jgi:hypothetical protein
MKTSLNQTKNRTGNMGLAQSSTTGTARLAALSGIKGYSYLSPEETSKTWKIKIRKKKLVEHGKPKP